MNKKILLSTILCLFIITTIFAGPYEIIWENTELFESGDYDPTRGIVWNPHTDHLLVVTRSDPYPRVEILDPETGDKLGEMDTTGLPKIQTEEGIGQIDIDDEGNIYVCDLGSVEQDWNFRVWRYDNEESSPYLVFDDMIDSGDESNQFEWYGASFEIIGSKDSTFLYTSGYQNNQIAVLKANTRKLFEIDHFIKLPSINSARHGITAMEPNGNLWISGAGTTDPPVRLISNAGDVLAVVPSDTMIGGAASEAIHWNLGPYNLITAINANAEFHTVVTVQYDVDELGTYTFDYFGSISDTLATGNTNATAVMRYDSTRNWLYCLDGDVFLAAMDLNNLANVTTPRDTGLFAIQLDGKRKEYTHYDKLGSYDNRTIYMTWSDDYVYSAISGNTLYTTDERGLYYAFNTDPNGDAGTSDPPDNSANISELPFKSDIIIKLDPWADFDLANDPADYRWTTGIVYQWNGSEWIENAIEGSDINYGALCYVGDGNDSLITEVGVARSPQGIGTDVNQMEVKVYLAETASDGEVLAAFPNNNETGSGVSFTSYYHFNDLGHGIYPAYDVQKVGISSGLDQKRNNQPTDFYLKQNYPNPFNPVTTIEYQLSRSGMVELAIFDIQGKQIDKLVHTNQKAGKHLVDFNGANYSSGIYFYRLRINGQIKAIKKMALIK